MNFKNFFIVLLLSGVFFYYTVVYSSFYKETQIEALPIPYSLIYSDSKDLNSLIVGFESKKDISKYRVSGACEIETHFQKQQKDIYFFKILMSQSECTNKNFYLKDIDGNIILNTHFEVKNISKSYILNYLTDYDDATLVILKKKFQKIAQQNNIFSQVDDFSLEKNFIRGKKIFQISSYFIEIIDEIGEKRRQKYQIPVVGRGLPDGRNISKFPNGQRPYRASYTTGIHEGWDIDAPNHSQVVALDDGVVVRVISGFQFEDLAKLQKSGDIGYIQKLENLNILRGNQVWIKTMKGDVAFYSHLSEISEDIKEGALIKKGQYIGKTGITGVPDREYSDYHLHIELKKNPYTLSKAGKNTFYDYMNWDWHGKNLSVAELLNYQYTLFEK